MSTFIMLANWSDQGIRAVKDSPKRLDAARAALESAGGKLKSFYMTMGRHDMVFVLTAPDDAAAARFAVQLGQLGNVRTETLRAFEEAEYRQVVGSLK
jgi:uncharacterized protein with GYD domain